MSNEIHFCFLASKNEGFYTGVEDATSGDTTSAFYEAPAYDNAAIGEK